jgi:hypothetical protein
MNSEHKIKIPEQAQPSTITILITLQKLLIILANYIALTENTFIVATLCLNSVKRQLINPLKICQSSAIWKRQ